MSERIPEYVATEGPAAVGLDALDDACSKAFDELLEVSQRMREFVCMHPFHLDVGTEFLLTMRIFASTVDAYAAASDAVEAATPADCRAPVFAITHEAAWRAGFVAGALAQRDWLVAYARGRGWVSTAAAIELTAPVAPPAITEEATDVRA